MSTENSPNHCWKNGFESRYGGFLSAIQHKAFAGINNLAAMTVAEDKGLLAVLHDRSFQDDCLTDSECDFIEEHVLATARLSQERVNWKGEQLNLSQTISANRDAFVIKPSNEGRGFGLCVGAHCTQDEWDAAIQVDENLPKVVQEHYSPVAMRVNQLRGRESEIHPMYLTVGLAMMCGRFQGLLSRISRHPVTNISRSGMVQAVFLSQESV